MISTILINNLNFVIIIISPIESSKKEMPYPEHNMIAYCISIFFPLTFWPMFTINNRKNSKTWTCLNKFFWFSVPGCSNTNLQCRLSVATGAELHTQTRKQCESCCLTCLLPCLLPRTSQHRLCDCSLISCVKPLLTKWRLSVNQKF